LLHLKCISLLGSKKKKIQNIEQSFFEKDYTSQNDTPGAGSGNGLDIHQLILAVTFIKGC